jgi:hypothetical protein
MAVTFEFDEANGAGTTITHGITTTNWKNLDGATGTDYNTNPITIGNNSFEKWQFGHFSGTWNQISNGFYDHTLTAFGSNLTLKGQPTMTADGNKLTYATPSTAANASLTKNITSANGSFPTGAAVVWFSKTSQAGTMTASVTNSGADSAYTNYLTTQLQTAAGAATGDTANVTLKLQYDEN